MTNPEQGSLTSDLDPILVMNSYKKLDLFYLTQLESRLSSCLEISRGILKRESEVVKSYNNIPTKSQIFSPERPGLEELENQMKLLALDREDPHRLTDSFVDYNDLYYEKIACVGKGSFGKCFLVKHKKTTKRLCLKIIDLCKKNCDIEDARAECSYLNRIKNVNCMSLFDLHVNVNMELHIYMEYCPWSLESLRLLRTQKGTVRDRLDIEIVWCSMFQALNGLAYLSEFGLRTPGEENDLKIAHLDIKSENLIVTYDGLIKIADFGMAMILRGNEKVNDGIRRGSNAYMAPEVMKNEEHDEKADMWSLGISFYELSLGHLPRRKSKDSFWPRTINLLRQVCDERRALHTTQVLQKMIVPDCNQRSSAIDILKGNLFASYTTASCQQVVVAALKKGNILYESYLKFEKEIIAKGREFYVEVPTSSSSSTDSESEESEDEEESEESEESGDGEDISEEDSYEIEESEDEQ